MEIKVYLATTMYQDRHWTYIFSNTWVLLSNLQMGKLMLSKVNQLMPELEFKSGSAGLPSHKLSTIPQFLFLEKRSRLGMTMDNDSKWSEKLQR